MQKFETSAFTNAERAKCEQAFNSVYPLIVKTVRDFQQAHGGFYDDLLSRARFHFIWAYQCYNPKTAKFTTWVRNAIFRRLYDDLRKDKRQLRRREQDIDEPMYDMQGYIDAISDLTEQSKAIIESILNPPVKIRRLIQRKNGDVKHVLKCVTKYWIGKGMSRRVLNREYKLIVRALW